MGYSEESWLLKCFRCGEVYRTTVSTRRMSDRMSHNDVTADFPRVMIQVRQHQCAVKKGRAKYAYE